MATKGNRFLILKKIRMMNVSSFANNHNIGSAMKRVKKNKDYKYFHATEYGLSKYSIFLVKYSA